MSAAQQTAPVSQSDDELLASFVGDGCQQAFTEIVRRHGPLVMSVCTRTLTKHHDAEDAFQATFIVLARSAAKIKCRKSLASWLYGVAFRVSARRRQQNVRQPVDLIEDQLMTADDPFETLRVRYEQNVTDGELNKLPESLRAPMLLRYLVGKSNHEIANQMNLTVSAVEGRLKRAKARLRIQLAKHGVSLSVVLLAMNLTKSAQARVAPALLDKTVLAGMHSRESVASNQSHDDGESSWLAEQEIISMTSSKATQLVGAFVLCGCLATVGIGIHDALRAADVSGPPSAPSNLPSPVTFAVTPAQPHDLSIQIAQRPAAQSPDGRRRPLLRNALTERSGVPSRMTRGLHSPADQKIVTALSKPDQQFSFMESPLPDVARQLAEQLGVPVLVNREALEDAGIEYEVPVTIELKGVKAASALKHMLHPKQLGYTIRDEVLVITSIDEAHADQHTIVYRTADVSRDLETLIDLITSMIQPDSWDEVGGAGSIASFEQTLVVSATSVVHEQIESLLDRLAAIKSQ